MTEIEQVPLRGEKMGTQVGMPSLSPHTQQCCLPCQHGWCAPPNQIPQAAATLTSEDQATSIILIDEEDLPI